MISPTAPRGCRPPFRDDLARGWVPLLADSGHGFERRYRLSLGGGPVRPTARTRRRPHAPTRGRHRYRRWRPIGAARYAAIPIVFIGSDPVRSGLVANLHAPAARRPHNAAQFTRSHSVSKEA